MGGTPYSKSAYADLSASYSTKTQSQVFTKKTIDSDMNPNGLKFRECRDSDVHPESIAIIVALDETGSMGSIPEYLIKNKLNALMETLINHGVKDASICFMGIGDQYYDQSPLQVGQFESGTLELDKWLTSIYLEGCGGGNGGESYQLAWLIGARHTSIDCFEKRGIKGFLFTIGDEPVHKQIESDVLKNLLDYKEASDISTKDILEEAKKTYNVFHIHCNDGSYSVDSGWKKLLNENLLILDDSKIVAETIATTVAVMLGSNIQDITKDFDNNTSKSVTKALSLLTNDLPSKSDSSSGITAL